MKRDKIIASARKKPVLTRIDVRVRDELYELIRDEALEQDCTLGEVLTKLFAASKGRPELAEVEKGRPGRKPRTAPRQAVA